MSCEDCATNMGHGHVMGHESRDGEVAALKSQVAALKAERDELATMRARQATIIAGMIAAAKAIAEERDRACRQRDERAQRVFDLKKERDALRAALEQARRLLWEAPLTQVVSVDTAGDAWFERAAQCEKALAALQRPAGEAGTAEKPESSRESLVRLGWPVPTEERQRANLAENLDAIEAEKEREAHRDEVRARRDGVE